MMYITIWFIFKLPIFPVFCISSRLRKNDFIGKRRQIHYESYSDIHHSTRNFTLIPNLKSKKYFMNIIWSISCLGWTHHGYASFIIYQFCWVLKHFEGLLMAKVSVADVVFKGSIYFLRPKKTKHEEKWIQEFLKHQSKL